VSVYVSVGQCACLLVMFVSPAKMAEPGRDAIFGRLTHVGPRNHVLDGGPYTPRERSNFGSCPAHSKALEDAVYCSQPTSIGRILMILGVTLILLPILGCILPTNLCCAGTNRHFQA